MKKIVIIVVAFSFLSTAAIAQLSKQSRYEFTFGTGLTEFYGDLGGYSTGKNRYGLKDFTFRNTGYNININIRYRVLEKLSARLSLALGSFHSTDIKGSNENRGYESSTLFYEPSLIGEYHFLKNRKTWLSMKRKEHNVRSFISLFDFYLFAGFGGLQYNIIPNYKLDPFVKKTSGFTAAIPGGLGMNLIYSDYLSLGFEFGIRFSFSDNIDGFSLADSQANDVYHFLNLTFTYKL